MDAVEQEILDFSQRWAEVIVANDADAIGEFMADEWVIVGSDGATSKADFLASVASGDVTHAMMETRGEARIKVYGEIAVLTARVVNRGHYKGEPFAADEWTSDVFRRENGQWLCVLSHITPSNT